MDLSDFHNVFRAILGWNSDLGYIFRVHGQEFNGFRRITQSRTLQNFKLHRQEKFLYICDTLHMWEWDVRVLDIQDGAADDDRPVCVGGRGEAPPEFCSGPGSTERLRNLLMDRGLIQAPSAGGGKSSRQHHGIRYVHPQQSGVHSEFRGAQAAGETISTAFVESTINQVVSRRFLKKQRMQGTPNE